MDLSKEIIHTCIESDKQHKILAAEYRRSTRIIKKRISELHNEIDHLEPESPLEADLKDRLTILNQMYRTTNEIGREVEHYYEKGWCRSEIYTLNSR